MAMGQPYWCLERAPRMVDVQRMHEKGGITMIDECECVYDATGIQVYECEWCYERYQDNCTCYQDEINVNCQECF